MPEVVVCNVIAQDALGLGTVLVEKFFNPPLLVFFLREQDRINGIYYNLYF